MSTITCPAEGCDYEGETTDSVRSHINAKSGPEHQDKEALRAALADQTTAESTAEQGESEGQQGDDEQDESTAEGGAQGGAEGGAPDGSSDDDPEQGEEQGEAAEKPENDHPDSAPSSTAMPSDEEYDRLTSASSTETTTGSSTDESPVRQGDEGGLNFPALPVDPLTAALLVGLVLIAVLGWYWVRSDDSGQPATAEVDQDKSEDETTLIE